jgi:hypothetical protein
VDSLVGNKTMEILDIANNGITSVGLDVISYYKAARINATQNY